MRNLPAFSLFILMFIGLVVLAKLTVEQKPGRATISTPQFILSESNIASWREVEHGFSIKLTEDAKAKLFQVTTENLNKPIDIYVETQLVVSPAILEPISTGSLLLAVDADMRSRLLPLLPPAKLKVNDQP